MPEVFRYARYQADDLGLERDGRVRNSPSLANWFVS